MFYKKAAAICILLFACVACDLQIPEALRPLEGVWDLNTFGAAPGTTISAVGTRWILSTLGSANIDDVEVECLYARDYIEASNPYVGFVYDTIYYSGGLVANLPTVCQNEAVGYQWFVRSEEYIRVDEYEKDPIAVTITKWYFNFMGENTAQGIVSNSEGGWSSFEGTR